MNIQHQKRWTACGILWGLAILALLLIHGISQKVVEVKTRQERIQQMEDFFAARSGRIQKTLAKGKEQTLQVASPRIGGLKIQEELGRIAQRAGIAPPVVEIQPGPANTDLLAVLVKCEGGGDIFSFFDQLKKRLPHLRVDTLALENNPQTGKSLITMHCSFRYVQT